MNTIVGVLNLNFSGDGTETVVVDLDSLPENTFLPKGRIVAAYVPAAYVQQNSTSTVIIASSVVVNKRTVTLQFPQPLTPSATWGADSNTLWNLNLPLEFDPS